MRPKSDKEIEIMREGGKALAKILNDLVAMVQPGISPAEISAQAGAEVKSAGLKPILLGYKGYPAVMCISVNEAVVHGIPSKHKLEEGDLAKLDLAVAHRGMIIDSALTVMAGDLQPRPEISRLLLGTKAALDSGIKAITGRGTRIGDIASSIQGVLDKNKLGIIRDLVGHGVGYDIHENPNVPNYGVAGTGPSLLPGVTLAIEPIATLGGWQVNLLGDGWTIVTRDSSLAAHFEHTVLITENGAEILTSL